MEPTINQELTRQQRREVERQERKKGEGLSLQKRKIKKVLLWTIGTLIVIGIIYLLAISVKNQKPRPGEAFSVQGQEHIAVGATHEEYNSNLPTSGPHYAQPAKWGVYQSELPDEQVVHNLEHGGIWIAYKDIPEDTKTTLEEITKSGLKIIMTPRAKNDAPITLASWGRVQKFESFDRQAILDFIRANTNKSPEPFAK